MWFPQIRRPKWRTVADASSNLRERSRRVPFQIDAGAHARPVRGPGAYELPYAGTAPRGHSAARFHARSGNIVRRATRSPTSSFLIRHFSRPSYANTYLQQQCHPSTTGMYDPQQFDYPAPAPTVVEQGWQGASGPPQTMIDTSDRTSANSASFDLQGFVPCSFSLSRTPH